MEKTFTVLTKTTVPGATREERKKNAENGNAIKTPYAVKCTAVVGEKTYTAISSAKGNDAFSEEIGKELSSIYVDEAIAKDRLKFAKRNAHEVTEEWLTNLGKANKAVRRRENELAKIQEAKKALIEKNK